MGLSNKGDKLRLEEALKWRASFQNLLAHKGEFVVLVTEEPHACSYCYLYEEI